jgi:hypothetical protein
MEGSPVARQAEKTHLLDTAGYAYNFDRMMYINRKVKKAFSIEFVDDNPESEIASKIQESKCDDDWHFYTNLPMSEGTAKELKRVLQ